MTIVSKKAHIKVYMNYQLVETIDFETVQEAYDEQKRRHRNVTKEQAVAKISIHLMKGDSNEPYQDWTRDDIDQINEMKGITRDKNILDKETREVTLTSVGICLNPNADMGIKPLHEQIRVINYEPGYTKPE